MKRKNNKSFIIWHDKHGELQGTERWIGEDEERDGDGGPNQQVGHLRIDSSQGGSQDGGSC